MTNKVSHWSSVLLPKQIDNKLAKKFPLFVEPNTLFPYRSQMRVFKSFITVRLKWKDVMTNRRLNYDKRIRRVVKENRA